MPPPLQVLVEHCTAEREELAGVRLPRPSLSLKGDAASYTSKLQELVEQLEAELPDVPLSANTEHLFLLQHEWEARNFGHDYQPPQRPVKKDPRLGSFEVFLELNLANALPGHGPGMLVPLTSKLKTKKFPDVRRVIQLVGNAVVDNVQHLALQNIEAHQGTFVHELLHSTLRYAFSQESDQAWPEQRALRGGDRWAEALVVETWEVASARDLRVVPQMLMRSKSWHLLHQTLCSLHFLGAKLRKCGLKDVLGDLASALALVREISARDASDGNEVPASTITLLRQLNYELGTYLRFISKNAAALSANPTCLYVQAHKYSVSGLAPLKRKFAFIFQHLQLLAQTTDQEDRESTGTELLKFAYGVAMIKWARRSCFLDCFSETDQRWMGYCCQDLQARLALQATQLKQTLLEDADSARGMLQAAPDDEILGHFSKSRLFFILTSAVATDDVASTLRLELQTEEVIDAQHGFSAVHTFLNEIFMDQNIHSVEAHVMRDTEELHHRDPNAHIYSVTVGLAACAPRAAAREIGECHVIPQGYPPEPGA